MEEIMQKEGLELAAYTYGVERGKIREFAQAIGDPNPLYRDRQYARREGYRDVIAPLTFGACIDWWGGPGMQEICAILEINLLKVLHGQQEYIYLKEIFPGDAITAYPRVSRVERKEGRSGTLYILTIETSYINQDEEPVLVGLSKIIVRD